MKIVVDSSCCLFLCLLAGWLVGWRVGLFCVSCLFFLCFSFVFCLFACLFVFCCCFLFFCGCVWFGLIFMGVCGKRYIKMLPQLWISICFINHGTLSEFGQGFHLVCKSRIIIWDFRLLCYSTALPLNTRTPQDAWGQHGTHLGPVPWAATALVIGLCVESVVAFFSCGQAALRTLLSVCPSVCNTFFTMFPSSYHHEIFRSYYQWQKWCPCKRSRSEVKGQGHRGQDPI